jgi:hypothetical protein
MLAGQNIFRRLQSHCPYFTEQIYRSVYKILYICTLQCIESIGLEYTCGNNLFVCYVKKENHLRDVELGFHSSFVVCK